MCGECVACGSGLVLVVNYSCRDCRLILQLLLLIYYLLFSYLLLIHLIGIVSN